MSVDVAARLAEGAAAVGSIETYVAASHAVGRSSGPVTVADVREAYASEAGMRLDALEADCAALAGLAGAVEEGLRLEAEALAALQLAWQGSAGSAAADFLENHLAGGTAAAASLRTAANALRSLREELASLVDEKVRVAERFDDRWAAAHPLWLAEAKAVLRGFADDASVEVVARQISPYVDGDVRSYWMPAMRDATDSVATAYDGAVARLNGHALPQFDSPGTGSADGQAAEVMSAPLPAQAAPPGGSGVCASGAAAPPGGSGVCASGAAAPLAGSGAQWAQGQWAPGQWGGMSTGLPGIGGMGGGLPALIGRIADLLGSYVSTPNLGTADELTLPAQEARKKDSTDQKDSADEKDSTDEADGADQKETKEKDPEQGAGGAETTTDAQPVPLVPATLSPPFAAEAPPVGGSPVTTQPPAVQAAAPLPVPVTESVVPPLPVPPVVRREPATAGAGPSAEVKTPCSIAADELPQVGQ